MSPRHPLKPREVAKMLSNDGWAVKRKGPGDHVQWVHPTKKGKVTLDMGVKEIPTGHIEVDLPSGGMGMVRVAARSEGQQR